MLERSCAREQQIGVACTVKTTKLVRIITKIIILLVQTLSLSLGAQKMMHNRQVLFVPT